MSIIVWIGRGRGYEPTPVTWALGRGQANSATGYPAAMEARRRRRCHVLKDSLAPSENHHEIDCSRSIVIDCRCGEKLILLGHRSDWHGQGRTDFECSGCGAKLSLKDGR